jgi:hypothetical protein
MSELIVAKRQPIPPPNYTKFVGRNWHINAVLLIERLHLLEICQLAVEMAH